MWLRRVEVKLLLTRVNEVLVRPVWQETTWETPDRAPPPRNIMGISPCDSLKRAMLDSVGAKLPAAYMSDPCEGQNERADMIPMRVNKKRSG